MDWDGKYSLLNDYVQSTVSYKISQRTLHTANQKTQQRIRALEVQLKDQMILAGVK